MVSLWSGVETKEFLGSLDKLATESYISTSDWTMPSDGILYEIYANEWQPYMAWHAIYTGV